MTEKFSNETVLTKRTNVVVQKIGKETVLVPIRHNVANMDSLYNLNETGTFIWDKIDGKNTIRNILNALLIEFDVDENSAQRDLYEFIERLSEFVYPTDPLD